MSKALVRLAVLSFVLITANALDADDAINLPPGLPVTAEMLMCILSISTVYVGILDSVLDAENFRLKLHQLSLSSYGESFAYSS